MADAAATGAAVRTAMANPEINLESRQLTELNEQKNELLAKVATLKKELQDWRGKLDNQVKQYRTEVGDLRKVLNSEVEGLRSEMMELKTALKQQLSITEALSMQECEEAERRMQEAGRPAQPPTQ